MRVRTCVHTQPIKGLDSGLSLFEGEASDIKYGEPGGREVEQLIRGLAES